MKKMLKFNEIEAMLPKYVKDTGNCTEIFTKDGAFIKSATIETCVKNMADYYNISLYHNRINYGSELGITNKVPIVINEKMVYVYVNVREPIFKHDAAYGYVNINAVKEVFLKDGHAAILMDAGYTIQTRQSIQSLKRSILNGRLARDIYKEKHKLI
ncbi:competence protein ComK [Sedimentibacter sp.]|uniref:competence protein ComK n=1 Tax=Sedimentibacter sp. TaxID=1960295 RepID=UPI0028A11B9F|nr:competence protein ComK [Sedimentibacter sp.]